MLLIFGVLIGFPAGVVVGAWLARRGSKATSLGLSGGRVEPK